MPTYLTPTGDGTAPACPSCRRPLPTWGGDGQPLPHHYAHLPGVGVPCDGTTAVPTCTQCQLGHHSLCTGGTLGCPTGCQCRTLLCTRVRDARLPLHQRSMRE